MDVSVVSSPNVYPVPVVEPEDVVEEPVVSDTKAAESEEVEDEGKGALRLLQDGHFNGVSDVRLRINFHEELAAMEAEEQKAAVEGMIDELLAAISSGLEPFLEMEEEGGEPEGDGVEGVGEEPAAVTVGGLAEQFESAVVAAEENFLGAAEPSQEDLAAELTGAFDTLVAGLLELFGTDEETDGGVTEEGSLPEDVVEPDLSGGEVDVSEFIAALESLFGASFEEIMSGLDGASVLGELSEANGNGGAYEKFLAIYNELYGIDVDEDPLETVA